MPDILINPDFTGSAFYAFEQNAVFDRNYEIRAQFDLYAASNDYGGHGYTAPFINNYSMQTIPPGLFLPPYPRITPDPSGGSPTQYYMLGGFQQDFPVFGTGIAYSYLNTPADFVADASTFYPAGFIPFSFPGFTDIPTGPGCYLLKLQPVIGGIYNAIITTPLLSPPNDIFIASLIQGITPGHTRTAVVSPADMHVGYQVGPVAPGGGFFTEIPGVKVFSGISSYANPATINGTPVACDGWNIQFNSKTLLGNAGPFWIQIQFRSGLFIANPVTFAGTLINRNP